MTAAIIYNLEDDLEPAEFIDVLERSGLAARRPVGEDQRIRVMVENAYIAVVGKAYIMECARASAGRPIGVSRALTDFTYCCYLSDLAVDAERQGRGIEPELIRRTHSLAGRGNNLVRLSAPASMEFYPKAGLDKLDTCCFSLPRAAPETRERP